MHLFFVLLIFNIFISQLYGSNTTENSTALTTTYPPSCFTRKFGKGNVTFKHCRTGRFSNKCCIDLDMKYLPSQEICIFFLLVPNELALTTMLSVNDQEKVIRRLDPSSIPLCMMPFPFVFLCVVINHVNIDKKLICTKLTAFKITVLKLPCISILNNTISMVNNKYF